MTRDEMLAMDPGRELDALVAEKVMGWKRVKHYTYDYEVWGMRFREDGLLLEHMRDSEWYPSEEISAAWDVVDAIKSRGITFWYDTEKWISETWVDGQMIRITAPEAPEAICKAALLAVMDA